MDEQEFQRVFTNATSLYANPGVHEGSASAYWQHLKRYPTTAVKAGFGRAVKSSPDFFPSAERVRECAEAAAKTASLVKPDYTRPALPERREFVPAIGAGHEAWVNEGTNALERLGRTWQVESKHEGWDHGKPMSEERGQQRFKEFWAAWAKTEQEAKEKRAASRTAPTSGTRQAVSASPSTGNGSSASPQSSASSGARRSHGAGCVCEACFAALMRQTR
jgi:hypothetical protein